MRCGSLENLQATVLHSAPFMQLEVHSLFCDEESDKEEYVRPRPQPPPVPELPAEPRPALSAAMVETSFAASLCEPPARNFTRHLQPEAMDCDVVLDLSNVTHSNLGGFGPDDGAEDLRYGNVLPGWDLLVSTKGRYEKKQSFVNGNRDAVGVIGLAHDSAVDVHFRIVMSGTQDSVIHPPKRLLFTIFGLDQTEQCGCRKEVEAYGIRAFYLAENTEIGIEQKSSVRTRFWGVGAQHSDKDLTVVDPTNITEAQANRALTLMYERVAQFVLTFKIGSGIVSRNFMFTGVASLESCHDLEVSNAATGR
jgi:hypothetical protein